MNRPRHLLFVHGLGQTPLDWQAQVEQLPAGTTAAAPWLRGLRPGDPRPFDLTGAADDLVSGLDEHGVDKAAVVGLSLGAMTALVCAATHPDRVEALVVAAGQVHPPRAVLAQRAALRLLPPPRADLAGRSPAVRREVLQQVLRALDGVDLRPLLSQVRCPTLVLVGQRDRANRPAARQLAAGIRTARLQVIPAAGHQLNRDAPAAFTEAVFGFLAEV